MIVDRKVTLGTVMVTSRGLRSGFCVAGLALLSSVAEADNLPTGGQIVGGSGSISQSGSTMTITQNSANLVANWQSFSIGQGHTVDFRQPSASAVALNRVLGSDVSVIQGALRANGKVFLVNPNGVTFTQSAQVNTGGLVASTLDIRNEDFMAGRYVFTGDSSNAVVNQGNIGVADGGTVALIAARIVNQGTVTAQRGNVLMGAGKTVVLDLGGPIKLSVEEGALDTLIEQGGAVRADGGLVYLTAKAAGTLATSVINHTGITTAKTLASGEKGEIVLLSDMGVGVTNVAGELNASAPEGGDGGFIETSGHTVDVAAGTLITAGAEHGRGGDWLIDPFNYLIDGTAAGNIASTLNTGTNVTVTTAVDDAGQGSGGNSNVNGDITVASDIGKTAGGDATLTLQAANNIVLNAEIKSTHNKLNLILDADNDGGTRDGGGVIIANRGVSLNGGNLDFGTGATLSINGSTSLVGGDLYVGGSDQVVFATGGGNINLYGQMIIANPLGGVKFNTGNGNATFHGIINSGNRYEKVAASSGNYFTWDQAFADAKNGTAGGSATGDSYLATVTSRLENAVAVYTGDFPLPTGNNATDLSNGAWLGGKRNHDPDNRGVWYWVSGPEGQVDNGAGQPAGLAFSISKAGTWDPVNGTSVNGGFISWKPNEPNGGETSGGEDHLQIGDAQGRWNDLPNDAGDVHMQNYIRETNLAISSLEIDAGTGSITFGGAIGELKPINYTAYDASNPRPSPPNTNTSSPASDPPPSRQGAIAGAQTVTAPNTVPPPPTLPPEAKLGSRNVGSMDIVEVSESDLQNGGDGQGQSELSNFGNQAGLVGPTKVFVVDGGVRLPAQGGNTQNGEETP